MAIKVDAYLADGTMSGYLARPVALRETLEGVSGLPLEQATWLALDASVPDQVGSVMIAADDVLVAVGDEQPAAPVHATWHHVSLVSGPWRIDGELSTLPGFDPGRSLTRPSGEFVLLREVRLSQRARAEDGVVSVDHALINRYGVDRIRAELMLGFFFPGAALEPVGGVGVRP